MNKDNILKVFTVFAIFIMLVAFLPVINNSTATLSTESAMAYLTQHGYLAYADLDDNWTVTGDATISGDLDVTGTVTGDGSGLTGVDAETIDGYNAPRTATLVVAASDASAASKAQADYVCDGTADNVEIQAAINALTGGRTWVESVKLIGSFTLASSVVIVGKTFLDLEEARLTLVNGVDDDMFQCSGYDILIKGGILDGNEANEATGSGIDITDSSTLRINGTYIQNFKEHGIYANNTAAHNTIYIQNVTCYSNLGNGIYLYGNGGGGSLGVVFLSNCILSTNTSSGAYIRNITYPYLNDCYVDSNGSSGLRISSCSGGVVNSCQILSNDWRGVLFENSQDFDVSSNLFESNHAAALNAGAAVYLNDNGCSSIRIDDNGTIDSTIGITYVRGVYIKTGCVDIQVKNNDFVLTEGAGNVGVYNPDNLSSRNIYGNLGYLAPAEVRTSCGSLTAGVANAICFAWHNPETQDILIKKVVVEVTTAGGTPGSHLDVGIADDAAGTNRGVEFFDDLDLNAQQINDSWVGGDGGTQTKYVFCQDNASGTDGWVVGQILDANAGALVGKYYIEYVGR